MSMRALTLTQPWATLVVIGAKRVETRSWRTAGRGPLAIHAAKGFPRAARDLCEAAPFCDALGGLSAGDLPRGMLLGTVEVLGCVPTDGPEAELLDERERAFGDYSPGRWAWLLSGHRAFDEPVPMSGALGIWRVPEDLG
jgi:hypothetical protein